MNRYTIKCYKCGKFLSYDYLDSSECDDDPIYEPDYELYEGYWLDNGGTYHYKCLKCKESTS